MGIEGAIKITERKFRWNPKAKALRYRGHSSEGDAVLFKRTADWIRQEGVVVSRVNIFTKMNLRTGKPLYTELIIVSE